MSTFNVIFDLNGTLVDTESAYFLAYKDVLKQHGVDFTMQEFTDNWSTKGKKLNDYLENIGRQDLLPQEKAILKEKDDIFQKTINERVKIMDGATEILIMMQKKGILPGLDSSTTRENIGHILYAVRLESFFRVISAGDTLFDETKYGDRKKKESRLRYLADQMQSSPEHTIVIGDAEKDLSGAKKAGMKVVAIPNQYTQNNDFSLADCQFSSLRDISITDLEILVQ